MTKKASTFSFVVDVGNSHTVLGIFKGDKVVDYVVEYPDDFVAEHLDLGKNYSFLKATH